MARASKQPVTERITRWLKRKWRKKWKGTITRIVGETVGVAVFGSLLVALWFQLPADFFMKPFSNPQTSFQALLAEAIGDSARGLSFWLLSWVAIAGIFFSVRDPNRNLWSVWRSRPQTILYCVFLTGISIAGLVLGGLYREMLSNPQVLEVIWWQHLIATSVVLLVVVAVVDGLYRGIYN